MNISRAPSTAKALYCTFMHYNAMHCRSDCWFPLPKADRLRKHRNEVPRRESRPHAAPVLQPCRLSPCPCLPSPMTQPTPCPMPHASHAPTSSISPASHVPCLGTPCLCYEMILLDRPSAQVGRRSIASLRLIWELTVIGVATKGRMGMKYSRALQLFLKVGNDAYMSYCVLITEIGSCSCDTDE